MIDKLNTVHPYGEFLTASLEMMRATIGLRDNTSPQIMDASITDFTVSWNQMMLEHERRKTLLIQEHYRVIVQHYKEAIQATLIFLLQCRLRIVLLQYCLLILLQ